MFQQEAYDVEPKRRLKAGESAQLIFVILILANSGYLVYYANCKHYNVLNMFMFFGALIWFIFLLLTLVIQFKNKGTRALFNIADWIFILFNLGLFIWANVKYWRYSNTCEKCWDWWVFIYLVLGYIAAFAALCVIFMGVLRKMNKKAHQQAHPDHGNVQHEDDYNELAGNNATDYDFYEY